MMNKERIEKKIDGWLKKWVDVGANLLPGNIDEEMADPNQDKEEEWRTWFPIASKITNEDIEKFESRIGYKYPEDYKIFLKYKHFYELQVSEINFFKHPINSLETSLAEIILHEGHKDILASGYIPFANWSDWGLLCFDTNRNKENNNYPIVLWDHERPDEVEDIYDDFYNLIVENE